MSHFSLLRQAQILAFSLRKISFLVCIFSSSLSVRVLPFESSAHTRVMSSKSLPLSDPVFHFLNPNRWYNPSSSELAVCAHSYTPVPGSLLAYAAVFQSSFLTPRDLHFFLLCSAIHMKYFFKFT